MLYNNYLNKLAIRFETLFREIGANHNFDFGPEFEIANCMALRAILPQRFGVCRGFVVPADGPPVGDDIIIFDRERFSTLRMIGQDSFARKEEIPLEAVCAYIEAKHTLHVEGDGPQSLDRAMAQVAAIRQLRRSGRLLAQADPYLIPPFRVEPEDWWPDIKNPVFGAVFARRVAIDAKAKDCLSPEEIREAFRNRKGRMRLRMTMEEEPVGQDHPDLIVAGPHNLLMPYYGEKDGLPIYKCPFHMPGKTRLCHAIVGDLAFAMGVCSLLFALDTMQLGQMPWQAMIYDGLQATKPKPRET